MVAFNIDSVEGIDYLLLHVVKSVVNSEINANWRIWHRERWIELFEIANVIRGLWFLCKHGIPGPQKNNESDGWPGKRPIIIGRTPCSESLPVGVYAKRRLLVANLGQ